MEGILQQVDVHFHVALPWRHDIPYKLNKRRGRAKCSVFEEVSHEELLRKYRTTMNDFIERRHAERVSEEELNATDRPV